MDRKELEKLQKENKRLKEELELEKLRDENERLKREIDEVKNPYRYKGTITLGPTFDGYSDWNIVLCSMIRE